MYSDVRTDYSSHHSHMTNSTLQNFQPEWRFPGSDAKLLLRYCKDSIEYLKDNQYIMLDMDTVSDTLNVYITDLSQKHFIMNEFHVIVTKLTNLKRNVVSFKQDMFSLTTAEAQQFVQDFNNTGHYLYFLQYSPLLMEIEIYSNAYSIKKHVMQTFSDRVKCWLSDLHHKKTQAIGSKTNAKHAWSSTYHQDSVERGQSKSMHRRNAQGTSFVTPPKKPTFTTPDGLDVYVIKGSITDIKVDAIVNAANERLDHIGGVAYHIKLAAGFDMEDECLKIIRQKGNIKVSKNVVTTAGRMHTCKNIIHAVGPKWKEYQEKDTCLQLLSDTVENVLDMAEEMQFSSIAMPALSAGIFGVPKPFCAAMYIRGILESGSKQRYETWLSSLYIVDLNDDVLQEVQKAYSMWNQDKKSIKPSELLKQESLTRLGGSFLQAVTQPGGSASGNGGNVTTSSARVSNPLYKQKWTKCPDEKIPGLLDKVRCYQTDDRSFCVKIYTGSITKVRSLDAIVCTADTSLSGLGPLSKAVADAGGNIYKSSFLSQKQIYSRKAMQGQVFMCSAGNLAVKHVVHIVIERLSDTKHQSMVDYRNFILKGLYSINGYNIKSAALPLLAGGSLHHDEGNIKKMCDIWYEAVMDFCLKIGPGRALREIHFVNRKPEITQAFVDCFNQNMSSVKSTSTGPALNAGAGISPQKRHIEEVNSFSRSRHDAKPKTHQEQGEEGNMPPVKRQRLAQSLFLPKIKCSDGGTNKKGFDDFSFVSTNGSVPYVRENKTAPKNELFEEGNMKLKGKCQTRKTVTSKSIHKNVCASCDAKLESDNVSRLACGHSFCSIPCFIPMQSNRKCTICEDCEEDEEVIAAENKEVATCVICMDTITDQKKLPCGHVFCSDCIRQSMAHKPACPVCGRIFGELEGDQPENGTMTVKIEKYSSLLGYEDVGTIEISYKFKDGIQEEGHSNPGKRYKGTERRAFLPNNKEGQKVLRLLQKAFDSRLTFTIGSSRTTGLEDVVTWNDIHHKTKRNGGAAKFGYPDPTYLSRVQDELAAKGIKE